MEELENEQQLQSEVNTTTQARIDTETKLDTSLRLEEMMKSEKEVKTNQTTELEGLTETKQKTQTEDKVFSRAEDKKKKLFKRRKKITASIFGVCIGLLVAFVGVNIATMVMLSKEISTNTETITSQQTALDDIDNPVISSPTGEDITINLNEPRDYTDDKKELTFLDKLTILFRNIFG